VIGFLARRLAQGLVVIWGAITISFLLASVSGNAIDARLQQIDPGTRERLLHEYGFDEPVLERYGSFVVGVLHGDFGSSIGSTDDPLTRVAEAVPYTLTLVVCAVVAALCASVLCATLGITRRGVDGVLRRAFIVVQGVPEFYLGLVFILVFAVWLGWLPSFGAAGPSSYVLPVAALALPLMSTLTRLLRGRLLDVLGMDFVAALRCKGLTERAIVWRHGMRNAAAPLIAYLALQIGWLLGGTLIVEYVFGVPGIGSLVVTASQARDLAVVQAVVVCVAIAYVLLNIVADIAVMFIDPRVRAET
jgi:ABC-type dipeptide/oligopeptide/nickel transport system permease component